MKQVSYNQGLRKQRSLKKLNLESVRSGNTTFGKIGESYAAHLLKSKGYSIIARNYKTHLAEIDLIAQKANILFFVEVKTRKSMKYGLPQEAVNSKKLAKIKLAGYQYLKENNLSSIKVQILVVAIVVNENSVTYGRVINVN